MRFIILVRTTPETEADVSPGASLMAALADWHEQLASVGMMVDAAGLEPRASAWRIHCSGDRCTIVDGPFAESEAVVTGYTIIRADSREEALEWIRCFPCVAGPGREAVIEVRQLYELDELDEAGADGTLEWWLGVEATPQLNRPSRR